MAVPTPPKPVKVAGLGGVTDMSEAHPLAARGFLVDAYEREPTYAGGARTAAIEKGMPQQPRRTQL